MTNQNLTYSPCLNCQKLNRISVSELRVAEKPICGNCKTELPIHGSVNELNASGLMSLVQKSPLPIVADFWAPWCAPCKAFAPIFEEASKNLAGEFVFAKIDTQANPLAADTYTIRSVPTLIVFRNGLERARQSSAMPLPHFIQWLKTAFQEKAA